MEDFTLVQQLDEVKQNVIQFNQDIEEYEDMRRRFFGMFRQWYYIKEIDLFAPSKYIGYRNMNALQYLNKDGSGADGRETEVVLKEWFVKREMPELLERLQERMSGYGKINKRSEIHILREEEHAFIKDAMDLSQVEPATITETEKAQIIKSRIGQSTFKKALLAIERKCRLCGVTHENFLMASHIKPWAQSTNAERLDANNGLLLCPNHDALFDKGFISFSEHGRILLSDSLDEATRIFLNVNEGMNIVLNSEQQRYMKWHRVNVYIG